MLVPPRRDTIAFISSYEHPSRDNIERAVSLAFPEYHLENVKVFDVIKSNRHWHLPNLYHLAADFGGKIAARRASVRDSYFRTGYLFHRVRTAMARIIDPPAAPDLARAHGEFARYRRYYLESGWFSDAPNGVDFYNAWGITYELFWINQIDTAFESNFITTAIKDSAAITRHLISPNGVPIMGRSICYRTALPVPLVAASLTGPRDAVENVEPDARRALDAVWRHFIGHGALLDGALTQGYYGPDLRFLDPYSGPGSCQWGLRSLVLAFMHGAHDNFWVDSAGSLPIELADYDLMFPKLGWRIKGNAASGEIIVEIPSNPDRIAPAAPYGWVNRLLEIVLRRPYRPHNHEAKYESRYYSSADPFPMRTDATAANRRAKD